MRFLVFFTVGLAISGCASSISVPVTGQIGKGAAAGQATANISGKGEFWVQVPGGMRCGGEYDALDQNPSFTVPVTCSDGRKGQMVVTRQLNGLSGTAIATLSDGTTGQFVFGNLKFEQAFGSGAAKTSSTQ